MPCATRATKGPSTSVLTEEEASHDESPHAARAIKDPSTNVLTKTEEEASHDASSTHEESEPEQEVYINCTHPYAPQPVYTNMYMPYIKGPKMEWMVNNAIYHRFLKWKLKCENMNARNVRRLLHGPVTLEWISMYPGGYPKMK